MATHPGYLNSLSKEWRHCFLFFPAENTFVEYCINITELFQKYFPHRLAV